MDRETYCLLENYMLSCMEDSAHDKEHIYRVLYHGLEIAKTENHVDYDVLITACLLHDIGRREQFENPALCHAIVGGQKAYNFLTEHGFEEDFANRVKHCIETHRYRQNQRPESPESPEAKILFDADKLDATGAMGIARTLIYKGSSLNRSIRYCRMAGSPTGSTIRSLRFFRSISISWRGCIPDFIRKERLR